MAKLNRPVVVLVMALVTLFGAGIAVAAVGDDIDPVDAGTGEAGDTLFNYGYDSDNHIFLFNRTATDSTYDCKLENGTLTTGYGEPVDGLIPVVKLEEKVDGSVKFHPRDADESLGPLSYDGAVDAPCSVSGAVVGGPQGQINHGQFMRLFNHLVDMRGRGCLNRWLARSDLGKGDQKLSTSDVVPAFVPGDTGTVDFMSIAATCDRDKKDKTDRTERGNGHGKSGSRGKSGVAPGRNK